MQLKPIAEQTMVITGASSGIGLATALAAGSAGARVVAAARNEGALEHLVTRIEARGGAAAYAVCDVAREDDVRRVADVAVDRFGGFDTWFNNAGTTIFGKIDEVTLEDHRRLFETNYWGVVHGSLVAVEQLRRRGGVLINMGSMLSDMALPLHGPYNATKHAIKAFTDTLRIELMHEGAPVSVTLVKPAAINTPLEDHARNYLPFRPVLPPPAYQPDVVAQAVLRAAQHPMRDLVIGEVARILPIAYNAMPEVADRVAEAAMFRLQQTDQPANGQHVNLHAPTTGGSERGDHPLVLSRSPYTRSVSDPNVNMARDLGCRLLSAPFVAGGIVTSSIVRLFLRRPDGRARAPVAHSSKSRRI